MSANLVRLIFVLEAGAWHGSATERLWAEPLGKNRYRIRNSPFYAFGVSNEDIVLGDEFEGQVRFKGVLFRGGHSTYRLKLQDRHLQNPAFRQAWEPLERLGCSFEEGPVLSVDVPPATDIYAVDELLQAGEGAGVWDFEEGHCGHPLHEKKLTAEVAPPNSLLLIMDRSVGRIPERMDANRSIASTSTCVAVGTLAEMDGNTHVILARGSVPSGLGSPVFDGILGTPERTLAVCSVLDEVILEIEVAAEQTRVRVWANDIAEPSEVYILASQAGAA